MKRLEAMEMNGVLERAQEEFWSEAKRVADQVTACRRSAPGETSY
jgi:hypothetical protein